MYRYIDGQTDIIISLSLRSEFVTTPDTSDKVTSENKNNGNCSIFFSNSSLKLSTCLATRLKDITAKSDTIYRKVACIKSTRDLSIQVLSNIFRNAKIFESLVVVQLFSTFNNRDKETYKQRDK